MNSFLILVAMMMCFGFVGVACDVFFRGVYRELFFVESTALPLSHGMAWGGNQIKGNGLNICGAPAKCIYKLCYLMIRHCAKRSMS